MNEASDPRPALSPQMMWRILLAGNMTTLAVLLFVFHRMMPAAAFPELGPWVLIAGLVLAVPALLYHARARRKLEQERGLSANARQLLQLNQVVYACGLAELPGVMGALFYLFAREWWGTVVLLGATAVLLWRARPVE